MSQDYNRKLVLLAVTPNKMPTFCIGKIKLQHFSPNGPKVQRNFAIDCAVLLRRNWEIPDESVRTGNGYTE